MKQKEGNGSLPLTLALGLRMDRSWISLSLRLLLFRLLLPRSTSPPSLGTSSSSLTLLLGREHGSVIVIAR